MRLTIRGKYNGSLVEVVSLHHGLLVALAEDGASFAGFELGDFDFAFPVLLALAKLSNCILLLNKCERVRNVVVLLLQSIQLLLLRVLSVDFLLSLFDVLVLLLETLTM
jgi:hypothetical protein